MGRKERVVIGLSGGVDSSVAAYLLTRRGYQVSGVFMKNWHDSSVTINNQCPWVEDSTDAMLVADRLGIPFHVIDFSKEYRERIVGYMFSEYESGRTPNPDILCNREIKFDLLLKAAKSLGADHVATGHYCRKKEINNANGSEYRLIQGVDGNKDQSYFLCQLNQHQLKHAMFPIGHLKKEEVRAIAREADLVTAEKKDSQGLCFVGKVKLPDFLKQKLKPREGDIILIPPQVISEQRKTTGQLSDTVELKSLCLPQKYKPEQGSLAGSHNGAHYFTIGQRKGLNIGGTSEPLYVISTDTENNIVYTGMGDDHPGLLRPGLFIAPEDIHWIRNSFSLKPGEKTECLVRIRHRQPLVRSRLIMTGEGLYVLFEEPQRGVAPGQYAAFYISQEDGRSASHNRECIGSGVISAGDITNPLL